MKGLIAAAVSLVLIGIGTPTKRAEAKRAAPEACSAAGADLCGAQDNYMCCYVYNGKAYCLDHNCQVGMPGCQWEL